MSTTKKDVHRTGALGAILKQGVVKPIDVNAVNQNTSHINKDIDKKYLFSNPIHIDSAKLIEVNPSECRPWKYANRSEAEFGDIDELAKSLINDGQQEPILIRPNKNDNHIKYEVIFGRRRWEAAFQHKIKLIAILKDISDQDAACAQHAENKHRVGVSPYSDAMHYSKLLTDKCFKTEKELAEHLNIPRSTFNDLMSFTKIPHEIIEKISNVHNLNIYFASKIVAICNQDSKNISIMSHIAHEFGTTIKTSKQLIERLEKLTHKKQYTPRKVNYVTKEGKHIFSIRYDSNGTPCIVLQKLARQHVDIEELSEFIKEYISRKLENN